MSHPLSVTAASAKCTADDTMFEIVARVSQIKHAMATKHGVDSSDTNSLAQTLSATVFQEESDKKALSNSVDSSLVAEVVRGIKGVAKEQHDAVPFVYGDSQSEWIDASLFHLEQKENVFIRQHVVQSHSAAPGAIYFDRSTTTKISKRHCFVSSNPLRAAECHRWSIMVMKSGLSLQEIGVVGTCDVANISVNDKGIGATHKLGARAVYGCRMSTSSAYYGSWNGNRSNRCYRELRPDLHHKRTEWRSGDVVAVKLDLKKWTIKYYLNGKRVKKMMSVEPHSYFPFISFAGDCKYQLLAPSP